MDGRGDYDGADAEVCGFGWREFCLGEGEVEVMVVVYVRHWGVSWHDSFVSLFGFSLLWSPMFMLIFFISMTGRQRVPRTGVTSLDRHVHQLKVWTLHASIGFESLCKPLLAHSTPYIKQICGS